MSNPPRFTEIGACHSGKFKPEGITFVDSSGILEFRFLRDMMYGYSFLPRHKEEIKDERQISGKSIL